MIVVAAQAAQAPGLPAFAGQLDGVVALLHPGYIAERKPQEIGGLGQGDEGGFVNAQFAAADELPGIAFIRQVGLYHGLHQGFFRQRQLQQPFVTQPRGVPGEILEFVTQRT